MITFVRITKEIEVPDDAVAMIATAFIEHLDAEGWTLIPARFRRSLPEAKLIELEEVEREGPSYQELAEQWASGVERIA